MRRSISCDVKRSWTDLLAQEKSMQSNSSGVTSSTPLLQKTNTERGTERNTPSPNSSYKTQKKKGPKYQYFWTVMWATRKQEKKAISFFKRLGIKAWIPIVETKEKVNGEYVMKRENLLFNKLLIFIKPSHLQSLIDADKNNPFLAYVRDKTKDKVGNDYPPMIIPRHDMQNFQKFVSAYDEYKCEVKDPSKLTRKDDKNTYVVIEGKHTGLQGQRARYKNATASLSSSASGLSPQATYKTPSSKCWRRILTNASVFLKMMLSQTHHLPVKSLRWNTRSC